MRKLDVVGLVILILFGLGWGVRTCRKYTGEGYRRAKDLRAQALPPSEIEPGEVDGGYQPVVASVRA